MNIKHKFLILTILLSPQFLSGQTESYTIKKAPFSSEKYDEFSPVYYKNGIVYCSNRLSGTIASYSTSENKGLFKIYYINTTGKVRWQDAELLSKELKTKLNDGPVTFNTAGDTIYFSRNLRVDGQVNDLSGTRNKLGIFSAVLTDGKWDKVRELRFNNEWYNVTTPYLSPDGQRLYFASDKPGGYGGSDLYYCQWKSDYWDNPVNLGPAINTEGNESYPFINLVGELYFSSDGHPGLGGKDIFFSKQVDTTWLDPVRLDAPVNSPGDDFGIIIDSTLVNGYFSSNRGRSLDIYEFKADYLPLFYCENQRMDQTCFYFVDDTCIDIDPVNLQLEWDFGDGKKEKGLVVRYCFPGPGKYFIKQNIIEKKTGKILFNKLAYELELRPVEQPVINCDEVVIAGDIVSFDGLKSNLPGYEVLSYTWEFSDGVRANGAEAECIFKSKGEYLIKLGVTARDVSSGIIKLFCVSKKLTVFSNKTELATYKASKIKAEQEMLEISNYDHATINTKYSANADLMNEAVFQVELLSSKTRVNTMSNIYNNISANYMIKEIFLPDEGIYSYIIDEQASFMAVYPAYTDAVSSGFRNAKIKTCIYTDPAEIELLRLKRVYGTSADAIFGRTGISILPVGFPLLDQLVNLMKKYPDIRILVAIHTDNTGTPSANLSLSLRRAQSIITYLVSRGISNNRLSPAGYGGKRPIASNYVESERMKNRRVDFIIIK